MRTERLPFQKPKPVEDSFVCLIASAPRRLPRLALTEAILCKTDKTPFPEDPRAGQIVCREDLSAMFVFTGRQWMQIAPSERFE